MKRYYELDSLRGLAALTVVFCHCANIPCAVMSGYFGKIIHYTPLGILIAGHEAVMLFFVLSGYVLVLPFIRGPVPYPQFAVKRICRIYVPYFTSLVLSVIGCAIFYRSGGIPELGMWFNLTWTMPLTLVSLIQHFILIAGGIDAHYNTAMWSLSPEMRMSLIFPLVAAVACRFRFRSAVLFVLFLQVMIFRGIIPQIGDLTRTLNYGTLFIVGALAAKYTPEITRLLGSLHLLARYLFLGIGLLLYTSNFWILKELPFRELIIIWAQCVGSLIFITCALAFGRVSAVLLWKPIHFLGKISYSLYLLHGTVLFALVHLLYGHIPMLLIWALTVIVSIMLAALSYYTVEKPSIALGYRMADAISNRRKLRTEHSKS